MINCKRKGKLCKGLVVVKIVQRDTWGAKCERYLKEKEANEVRRKEEKARIVPKIGENEYNRICYARRKYKKRY